MSDVTSCKIHDNWTTQLFRFVFTEDEKPDALVWTLRADAGTTDCTPIELHNAIRALEEIKAGIDETIDLIREELRKVQE